jgi:sec-independent protein translocase protein TatA
MFGSVGWPQLLIVLLIVLVIFGAKRLPEVGRSLGSGMREFKDSITGKGDPDDGVISGDVVSERQQVTSGDDAERR